MPDDTDRLISDCDDDDAKPDDDDDKDADEDADDDDDDRGNDGAAGFGSTAGLAAVFSFGRLGFGVGPGLRGD